MISEVPVLQDAIHPNDTERFSAENVAVATAGVTAQRGAGGWFGVCSVARSQAGRAG